MEKSNAMARFEKLKKRDLESSMAGIEFQMMFMFF